MRDVLATGRKLLTWGYKGEVKCVFCRYGIEDGSFFFCGISGRVWKHAMGLCNVLNPPSIWDDIVDLGMQSWKGAKLKAYLYQLVFGYVVYNLFRTHNAICYVNHLETEEQLLKQIVWKVRTRILSKGKFKATKGNVILCRIWSLDGILV
jgi:hypothetical protein